MNKFKWPYKVPISDINYGGHMGNDKSLALFHEARIAFLKHLGILSSILVMVQVLYEVCLC